MNIEKDYLKLLFTIKKRTLLFLSSKSILNLGDFINGFWFGFEYSDKKAKSIIIPFSSYVKRKYDVPETKNVYGCLLILSNSDEEKAFDLFFEELETFLKENNIEIPEIK